MKVKIIVLSAMAVALVGVGQLKIEGEIYRPELKTQTPKVEVSKAVYYEPVETPQNEPEAPSEPLYESTLICAPIPEPAPAYEPVAQESTGGWAYYGTCTITHYCPCSVCNGGHTGTASGAPLTPYHTAASGELPFGTEVLVNGQIYVIEDTGVHGMWIDLCVGSHEEAYQRGMYECEVYIR